MSKSVQLIPQSKWLTTDLHDVLNPKPTDNRTAEEIADDVIKKAGLVLK